MRFLRVVVATMTAVGAVAVFIAARAQTSYTIVLIPDTQNYVGRQDRPAGDDDTYARVTGWIKNQRAIRNIVAAIHLGDITNSNGQEIAESQWTRASQAHDSLDDAGFAYSVVPGNHDHFEREKNTVLTRSVGSFEKVFGRDRFATRPWYLPTHPFDDPNNANNAITFRAGPWAYLVVSLDFAPTKNAVCWAGDLITQMKDHRVIVATHSYLAMGPLRGDSTRVLRYAGNAENYNIVGMDGVDLWNELVSLHSNIEMAVSGHITGGAVYSPRRSVHNTLIHQILVDYQDEERGGRNHGQGWLKMVELTPATGAVKAYPYSVLGKTSFNAPDQTDCNGKYCYSSDPAHRDHSFSFDLPLGMPPDNHDLARVFTDQTVNIAEERDQQRSRVAMSRLGNFVVVWEDDSEGARGVYEIMGRRFRRDGCGAPSQFTANANSTRDQLRPDVALDGAENAIVVWEDDSRPPAGTFQIYARVLSSGGAELVPTFTVNQVATSNQRTPRVAAAADGRFAVTWRDNRSSLPKVYVRGFTAEGIGSDELRIAPASTTAEADPAIAMEENGDIWVAWAAGGRVFASRVRADGTNRLGPIRLDSAGGWKGRPSIALTQGGFAAAWEECVAAQAFTTESSGCTNRQRQVRVRVFDASGVPQSAPVLASATNVRRTALPQIAAAPDGRFMVTWQDDNDGNGSYEILRRAFNASGTALPDGIQKVNKNSRDNQTQPAIAIRTVRPSQTRWVITWTDDLDGNDATQILARGGVF